MRLISVIASTLLAGCCWFGDTPLPEPATDGGLSGAESKLDHLTDKRDSRVAAAVITAKELSSDKVVVGELSVAEAMLQKPTAADLAFAKDRAEKGDEAFYAKQVEVSRQLAAALIKANSDYEKEKARKQAEYAAALKEKELALAAEQEARQSDKWTYAGIGLVTIGLIALFLTPMKAAAIGVALSGFAVGSFPIVSKQTWFSTAIVGIVIAASLGAFGYLYYASRKPSTPDEPNPPQDTQGG